MLEPVTRTQVSLHRPDLRRCVPHDPLDDYTLTGREISDALLAGMTVFTTNTTSVEPAPVGLRVGSPLEGAYAEISCRGLR